MSGRLLKYVVLSGRIESAPPLASTETAMPEPLPNQPTDNSKLKMSLRARSRMRSKETMQLRYYDDGGRPGVGTARGASAPWPIVGPAPHKSWLDRSPSRMSSNYFPSRSPKPSALFANACCASSSTKRNLTPW